MIRLCWQNDQMEAAFAVMDRDGCDDVGEAIRPLMGRFKRDPV